MGGTERCRFFLGWAMKYLMAILALGLSTPAALAQPDIARDAARCQACHETAGPSAVPRLNGQSVAYIIKRLNDFHDPTSQTPHATYFMWDIATSLGAAKARALAGYFAALPPASAKPADKAAALGDAFYHGEGGCQACHGAAGEGGDAAPRLTGQHGAYLRQQLVTFGLSLRYQPAMLPHTRALSEAQTAALVAYLGGD